ncbi:phage tail tube protein [Methylosinus sp. sav-2]|uniref:phage tail tube protein n=1 Tax=Methylosinus sp. sav-2 TaxID=2485168 RepID=UPI00047B9B85|nr:phage tail tube protein [Methylosinus sp. sav-2]TDX63998.1 phage tail tube protein [Methylosinus sp. sav-2]
MSFPNLQRGTAFKIAMGDGATPTEAFTLLCIATTKSFKRTIDTEDHMEVDATNPDNIPANVSVAKGQAWELSISGRTDYVRYAVLQGWLDGAPHNVKLTLSGTGANGGGTYTGGVVLKELDLTSSDGGTVAFSATLKGQGAIPTFVAAA